MGLGRGRGRRRPGEVDEYAHFGDEQAWLPQEEHEDGDQHAEVHEGVGGGDGEAQGGGEEEGDRGGVSGVVVGQANAEAVEVGIPDKAQNVIVATGRTCGVEVCGLVQHV